MHYILCVGIQWRKIEDQDDDKDLIYDSGGYSMCTHSCTLYIVLPCTMCVGKRMRIYIKEWSKKRPRKKIGNSWRIQTKKEEDVIERAIKK